MIAGTVEWEVKHSEDGGPGVCLHCVEAFGMVIVKALTCRDYTMALLIVDGMTLQTERSIGSQAVEGYPHRPHHLHGKLEGMGDEVACLCAVCFSRAIEKLRQALVSGDLEGALELSRSIYQWARAGTDGEVSAAIIRNEGIRAPKQTEAEADRARVH